ncbi:MULTISPECIES: PepSY domain-containing protein [unclassified Psychrosphaera]|uniref:PepSY domain-containing protein n=1 Tax=unclassified Psychrosphaera TaxID=2641570 RepID=UPI002091737A|nr:MULTISPECIES: PepSY domain-containing protein [unclassified Psychrosphaera]
MKGNVMIRSIRKYHKWLMAFVGVQFLFWSLTGLYMVSFDIHYIHGETLVKENEASIALSQVTYPISELLAQYPEAESISLTTLIDRPVYLFSEPKSKPSWRLVDAKTGLILPVIDKMMAIHIAESKYSGNSEIKSIRLLSKSTDVPPELSSRYIPVWKIDYDQFSSPTLYISQESGKLVTKRHDFWRLFDWMWRFHIMDYDDGENVANWFLLLVASLGILAAFAGAVLTYIRVFKPNYNEVK